MKSIHQFHNIDSSKNNQSSFTPIPNVRQKESAPNRIYLRDGEVVLYKRPDSTVWQVRFKLFDRKWHCFSTKHVNLEYAKQAASELYDEVRFKEKMGLGHSRKKFEYIARECIKEIEKEISAGIRPMTNNDYIRAINRYLIPFFANYYVENINSRVVDEYESWRNKKMKKIPVSSTLMTHASAYNRVIQHAIRRGWLNQSTLVAHLGRKGIKGKSRPGFTREELSYLLEYLKNYCEGGHSQLAKEMRQLVRSYIELLAYTGMRCGKESMNLKWRDIQWYVDRNTGKRYIRIWVDGKTGNRYLIAKHVLLESLERLIEITPFFIGKNLDQVLEERHDRYVFQLKDGRRPISFQTTFRWLMKASGLLKDKSTGQNRTLYSIRHTYATLAMTDINIDIHILARQMGTSVGMIEKHYSKLTATMAAEKLAW
jgi:integrase